MRRYGLKALLVALAVAAGSMVGPSMAAERYLDDARVLDAQPIVRTVRVTRPERHCVDRYRERPYHHHSGLPALGGAIIGGVIGNQFGSGHGRGAATVAGALLGSAIGHDIGRHHQDSRVVRDCDYVEYHDEREEVVGYRVKYEYRGEVYWTQTREHPGRWIKVRVSVYPLSE